MISRFKRGIRNNQSGFTLIEILMVVILISILAVASLELIHDSINDARYQETLTRVNQLRDALVGNPDLKVDGARTQFGFLGDTGGLPDSGTGIAALLSNPGSFGIFTADSTNRIVYGWNGPYLNGADPLATTIKDGWGRAVLYSATPPSQATLTSYGADGASGGSGFDQDIVVSITDSQTVASVFGFVCQNSGPFDAEAEIELNFPDGAGGLTQSIQHVSPGMNGAFSFFNIPFGVRSITVYVPGKTAPPTTVKGPSPIVIDKANFFVPCSLVDVGT
jgi:general secretion pathway protein G